MTGYKLYQGHALEVLKTLPDESVDMCMTSPPYYGLRSYHTEPIVWGGNKECEHEWDTVEHDPNPHGDNGQNAGFEGGTGAQVATRIGKVQSAFCLKCNAWRGELGLEPKLELYISHLVQIFSEVKRVLKSTGTCWVNIDDSYAGSWGDSGHRPERSGIPGTQREKSTAWFERDGHPQNTPPTANIKNIPAKSLCLIPERFALAMVNDNWILRNNVIWHKPNPMPESAKDRFTGSYEYLYFFTKSKEKSNDIKNWLPIPMKEIDRAWLAAMVDAEGTIGIRRSAIDRPHNSFGAYVTISNSNADIIEKCRQVTGIGKINKAAARVNLDIYRWEVMHNDAISVIGEIYPYLIAKREQAKVCIALQKTNIYRGNQHSNQLTEKIYEGKVNLWALGKALNQHQVLTSNLPEPNLNRFSGCEDYYFEQQFEIATSTDNSERDRDNTKLNNTPGRTRMGGLKTNHYVQRNLRDVWTIPTSPYKEAHFATFPRKLCETPIKAGCPKDGIVLDPFAGSGTTAEEAISQGKQAILIELSPKYCELIEKRLSKGIKITLPT